MKYNHIIPSLPITPPSEFLKSVDRAISYLYGSTEKLTQKKRRNLCRQQDTEKAPRDIYWVLIIVGHVLIRRPHLFR
jgi:hypothetical protein